MGILGEKTKKKKDKWVASHKVAVNLLRWAPCANAAGIVKMYGPGRVECPEGILIIIAFLERIPGAFKSMGKSLSGHQNKTTRKNLRLAITNLRRQNEERGKEQEEKEKWVPVHVYARKLARKNLPGNIIFLAGVYGPERARCLDKKTALRLVKVFNHALNSVDNRFTVSDKTHIELARNNLEKQIGIYTLNREKEKQVEARIIGREISAAIGG